MEREDRTLLSEPTMVASQVVVVVVVVVVLVVVGRVQRTVDMCQPQLVSSLAFSGVTGLTV